MKKIAILFATLLSILSLGATSVSASLPSTWYGADNSISEGVNLGSSTYGYGGSRLIRTTVVWPLELSYGESWSFGSDYDGSWQIAILPTNAKDLSFVQAEEGIYIDTYRETYTSDTDTDWHVMDYTTTGTYVWNDVVTVGKHKWCANGESCRSGYYSSSDDIWA